MVTDLGCMSRRGERRRWRCPPGSPPPRRWPSWTSSCCPRSSCGIPSFHPSYQTCGNMINGQFMFVKSQGINNLLLSFIYKGTYQRWHPRTFGKVKWRRASKKTSNKELSIVNLIASSPLLLIHSCFSYGILSMFEVELQFSLPFPTFLSSLNSSPYLVPTPGPDKLYIHTLPLPESLFPIPLGKYLGWGASPPNMPSIPGIPDLPKQTMFMYCKIATERLI